MTAEFEVGFVGAEGRKAHVPLMDSVDVPFERCRAVRSFPSYRKQRNFPGLWWSSTDGGHVGYESWLERDHLMLLDFGRGVGGVRDRGAGSRVRLVSPTATLPGSPYAPDFLLEVARWRWPPASRRRLYAP
jgi:hypothetical protein